MDRPNRLVVNWGHLLLLVVIGGVILAYLLDARAASLKVNNLLFVQPAALIGLALVAAVLPQCFRRLSADVGAEPLSALARPMMMMAALIAMAFVMDVIGFDIAVFLFLVIGLWLCGERNWLINIGFSAVFTVVLIYGYGAIIPFPFPLLIL